MLNMVALNGRLTADPETKTNRSGSTFTTFTLAVERNYVKQGQDRGCDFIEIMAPGKTGEFAAKYFQKGQLVAVTGELNIGSYTDQQGVKRKSVHVIAQHLFFAESKQGGNGNAAPANNAPANRTQPSQNRQPVNNQQPAANRQPASGQQAYQGQDTDFVEIDGDDDLPF